MSDSLTQTAQAKEELIARIERGKSRGSYPEAQAHNMALDGIIGLIEDDGLDALIAAVLADHDAQTRQDWQPVETAPKDGTHLLMCDARRPFTLYFSFDQNPPTVAHYHVNGWHLSVNRDGEQSEFTPTHWMPLPAPPAQKGTP